MELKTTGSKGEASKPSSAARALSLGKESDARAVEEQRKRRRQEEQAAYDALISKMSQDFFF